MDTLEIKTNTKTGDVEVHGDPAFFRWLVMAANNASNGLAGNEAYRTDGKGKLILVPTELATDQAPRAKLAHSVAKA